MNEITIYYYTAWNGYSWQGCGAAEAADLQRYMEAVGVLPGGSGELPPFGGAIACQIADKTGVAVYRCGVREKGDAFGRDSLFVSVAFIPWCGARPIDIFAVLGLTEMSNAHEGELRPVVLDASGLLLGGAERRFAAWCEESGTATFKGRGGMRDLSAEFFSEGRQLGLMQAAFSLEGGGIETITASLNYRVFPEVSALAEASHRYSAVKMSMSGPVPEGNPASRGLRDALNLLESRRVEKMPAYRGLSRYLREKAAELDMAGARRAAAAAFAERMEELSSGLEAFCVICGTLTSGAGRTAFEREIAELESYISEAQGVGDLPVVEDPVYQKAVSLSVEVASEASSKLAAIRMLRSWFVSADGIDRTAVLHHLQCWARTPEARIFNGLDGWVRSTMPEVSRSGIRVASLAGGRYEKKSDGFWSKLCWIMICLGVVVFAVWMTVMVVRMFRPQPNVVKTAEAARPQPSPQRTESKGKPNAHERRSDTKEKEDSSVGPDAPVAAGLAVTNAASAKPPAHLVGSRVPRDRRRAGRASLSGSATASNGTNVVVESVSKVADPSRDAEVSNPKAKEQL